MEEFEDTVFDGLQQTWIEIKERPVYAEFLLKVWSLEARR